MNHEVAARLAILAAQGLDAASFGTTNEHLCHVLDPRHPAELLKLIQINELKNRALIPFQSEPWKAKLGNGHASTVEEPRPAPNVAKARRAKSATSKVTKPMDIEGRPPSLADEIEAAKKASQQRPNGNGAGEGQKWR